MSRALIAIGVSKAGAMTPLPGAAQDAKAMHEWASVSQGYQHCELLTDDGANPVTLADVHAAVQRALQFGDLEHLIIYFSGHGYSPAPQTEYLLLTNWNVNGNEAINLSLTVHYALSHAPLYISIIVDACRTTWSTGAPPGGGVIFNRPLTDGASGKVDEFLRHSLWLSLSRSRSAQRTRELRYLQQAIVGGAERRCRRGDSARA